MKRNRIRGRTQPALVATLMAVFLLGATDRAVVGALPPEDAEKIQRLNGLVEDLLASQATLQKRLSALTDEIHSVREDGTKAGDRLNDRFATREELRKLAESVRELDRKREEDKRLILEEIRKLAQTPVVVPRESSRPVPKDPTPSTPGKGYTYVVKKDDTISAIVAAYRASGVKVSVDDVLKANPNLKPTSLPVGTEIFIPDPALK